MLDDAVFNDRFRKLVLRIWDARKNSEDIEAFAREHFNLSESGFRNWLRGTNATRDFLMIEALGRLDGMTLEETKAYFYGKEVSDNLEDRSLGESKALLCIAAAPVESLSKYLQAITDRLALIARDNLQHITPINKVAAEFSRSLCTVLVEQKMTLEEISVKCEIELPCLRAVAAGQKVPSHRVAIALQGLLKDFQGRVYEGEDLLEILEQVEPQIVKNVKTPPQQKRRKASQS